MTAKNATARNIEWPLQVEGFDGMDVRRRGSGGRDMAVRGWSEWRSNMCCSGRYWTMLVASDQAKIGRLGRTCAVLVDNVQSWSILDDVGGLWPKFDPSTLSIMCGSCRYWTILLASDHSYVDLYGQTCAAGLDTGRCWWPAIKVDVNLVEDVLLWSILDDVGRSSTLTRFINNKTLILFIMSCSWAALTNRWKGQLMYAKLLHFWRCSHILSDRSRPHTAAASTLASI